MTDTFIAIGLLNILIFLLGYKIGQINHQAELQNKVITNGFFMLGNGLYRAVKFKYSEANETATPPETITPRKPKDEPKDEPSEAITLPEIALPDLPEIEPTEKPADDEATAIIKKPIRRRNPAKTH